MSATDLSLYHLAKKKKVVEQQKLYPDGKGMILLIFHNLREKMSCSSRVIVFCLWVFLVLFFFLQ